MYIKIETNWCVTIWNLWNVVERLHKVQMRLNGIHLTNVDLQLLKSSGNTTWEGKVSLL